MTPETKHKAFALSRGVTSAEYDAINDRSAPKTTTERVAAMRSARDAAGLKRLELYAHPDDWPAIKALAERLQARRQRRDKREAG